MFETSPMNVAIKKVIESFIYSYLSIMFISLFVWGQSLLGIENPFVKNPSKLGVNTTNCEVWLCYMWFMVQLPTSQLGEISSRTIGPLAPKNDSPAKPWGLKVWGPKKVHLALKFHGCRFKKKNRHWAETKKTKKQLIHWGFFLVNLQDPVTYLVVFQRERWKMSRFREDPFNFMFNWSGRFWGVANFSKILSDVKGPLSHSFFGAKRYLSKPSDSLSHMFS